MAAGLHALRDDRVDAVRLQPARLLDRRRRRQDLRAPAAHARQQLGRRQPEVEAHHRRPRTRSTTSARLGAERRARGRRPVALGLDAELVVVRRERAAPRRLARRVGRRRRVAEEVDVERRCVVRPDGALARSAARPASSIAHGSEPSPPALDTAIASALPCTPAIGAWMMGNLRPRSSRRDMSAAAAWSTRISYVGGVIGISADGDVGADLRIVAVIHAVLAG